MPLYTLKCPKCNYTDDKFVYITKGVEEKHYCPECFKKLSGVVLERVFNMSNITFKTNSDRYKNKHLGDKGLTKEVEQRMGNLYDENRDLEDEENENI